MIQCKQIVFDMLEKLKNLNILKKSNRYKKTIVFTSTFILSVFFLLDSCRNNFSSQQFNQTQIMVDRTSARIIGKSPFDGIVVTLLDPKSKNTTSYFGKWSDNSEPIFLTEPNLDSNQVIAYMMGDNQEVMILLSKPFNPNEPLDSLDSGKVIVFLRQKDDQGNWNLSYSPLWMQKDTHLDYMVQLIESYLESIGGNLEKVVLKISKTQTPFTET